MGKSRGGRKVCHDFITILFFVLVLLFILHVTEHYSQTNVPILKIKPYNVTNYKIKGCIDFIV